MHTVKMPLRRLLAKNLGEFETLLKESITSGARVFVLFTGDADPATGKSWCPDCNDSKPLLNATLEEAGGAGEVALVEVPLVRAEYKGNPDHWARKHAAAKLKAIPTLMRWGAVAKVGELVEGECMDAERVRELIME